MTLKILQPIISRTRAREIIEIFVPIEEQNSSWNLSYLIPVDYEEYLTIGVADAFVVALLMYAMEKKMDIHSSIPVSDVLLMKLNKYLIPFLARINSKLHCIQIIAEPNTSTFKAEHAGTGISCGVDSLSTIIYHGIEESILSCKVDTLSLLNTGYYGTNENNSEHFHRYIEQSLAFCKKNNFKFLTVDSNVSIVTNYDFLSAHTYLTCSTLLLFQKYFSIYYYSSGYPIFNFEATFKDPAYYDTFLLDCISTKSLHFISSCSTFTRVEKTRMITKYNNISQSLYVCVSGDPSHNCSCCEKCIRTMLAFEALGLKNKLSQVFNEKIYKRNRIRYISYMLRHHRSNIFYKEIYEEMKRNHIQIPMIAYFNVIPCKFELLNLLRKISHTKIGKLVYGKLYHLRNK